MSSVETKVCLRLQLPPMTFDEAVAAFEHWFGPAVEVWPDSKEIIYNSTIPAVLDSHRRDLEIVKKCIQPIYWNHGTLIGVELILGHRNEGLGYHSDVGLCSSVLYGHPIDLELVALAKETFSAMGIPEGAITFHAYQWYNGGDEPIHF